MTQEPEFTAMVATTRPVRLRGGDMKVVFMRSAMENAIEQVRGHFVPMTIEHLSFNPPIGPWYNGEIVRAADGADELFLSGRSLRHFVPDADPNLWPAVEELLEDRAEASPAAVTIEAVALETRNYERDEVEAAIANCPYPVQREERWSDLPPIEWVFLIPVAWGLTRFLGSFLDTLGRESAEALTRWVRDLGSHAKDAHRDKLVTLRFVLPDGTLLLAHIPIAADADTEVEVRTALDAAGPVAAIAGAQAISGVLGEAYQAAFIWVDGEWHLSWVAGKDDIVRVTNWYRENQPDSARFLGRPPWPAPPE